MNRYGGMTAWLTRTFAIAVVTIFALASHEAAAQTITKQDNTTTLNLAGSWVSGGPPGSGNTALFDGMLSISRTANIGASMSWGGIQVTSPGGTPIIGHTASATLTLGAGGIDMSTGSGDFTIQGLLALGSSQAWNVGAGRTLTKNTQAMSGVVGNTLTKSGEGTLVISINNASLAGPIIVSAGKLAVTTATALGAAASSTTTIGGSGTLDLQVASVNEALVVNGGYVINSSATAASQITSGITLGAQSYFGGDGSGGLSLGGAFSGGYAINKVGTGTLTISSIIPAGGVGTITVDNGILILSGVSSAYNGAAVVNANGTLRAITSANALGTTTAPVGTTVNNGGVLDLQVALTAEPVAITGTGISSGGALITSSGTGSLAGPLTLNGASSAGGAGALTLSGTISGGYALDKVGAGTMTISTANPGLGTVTVQGGVLTLTGNSGSWNSATVVNNGGTLRVTTSANALGSVTGTTTVNSGGVLDLQVASVPESVSITGTGISSGGALITSSGTGSLTGSLTLAGASSIGGAGTLTLGGTISGGYAVNKVGAGTTTISTVNPGMGTLTAEAGILILTGNSSSWDSAIVVNGGALRVTTSANALGSTVGNTTVNSGGTLDVQITGIPENVALGGVLLNSTASSYSMSGIFDLAAGNSFSTTAAGSLTLTGQITGTGPLTKVGTGAGALILSNTGTASDYAGGTAINAGILRLGANGQLPDSASVTLGGGTLDLNACSDVLGVLTLTSGSIVGASGTLTPSAINVAAGTVGAAVGANVVLAGAGVKLTKTTAGTVTLNSTASTFTGTVDIQDGILSVGSLANANGTASSLGAPTSPSAEGRIVFGSGATSGTLKYVGTAASSTDRQLYLNGTSGSAILSADGTAAGNAITFTAPILITGAADATAKTLTLTGANTGANTISGSINDVDGATISLTKSGTGTWILSGTASGYSGTTAINQGILKLGSATGIPSASTVTFGGGTLDVNGQNPTLSFGAINGGNIVNGPVANSTDWQIQAGTIDAVLGGTVNLVKTTAGIARLNGINTYTGYTDIQQGELYAADGVGLPSGNVRISGAGGTAIWRYAGTISRSVGDGASQLQLTAATGGFSAIGGTLAVNLGASVVWGSSYFNPGTALALNYTGADNVLTFSSGIDLIDTGLSATRTINVYANRVVLSGEITDSSGTGSLTLAPLAASTLDLSSATGNSYSGATTLAGSGGMLRLLHPTALGSGPLALNSAATLDLSTDTGFSGANNTTVGAASVIVANRATSGAGVTHTLGSLGIGAFTLTVSKGANVASGTAGLTFNGNTTFSGAAPTFTPAVGVDLTLGALQSNVAFTMNGAGNLVLPSAANVARSSATATVTLGMLKIRDPNALGTSGATITLSGGTIDLATASSVVAHNVTLTAASGILPDVDTQSGAAVAHTLGTLTVNTAATPTITINAGPNVGSGTPSLTFGTTTLTTAPTFSVGTGVDVTLGGLSGTSTLTKSGAGRLILGTAPVSRASGTTIVSGGILRIENATAIGTTTTPILQLTGGTVDLATAGTVNAYPMTSVTGTSGILVNGGGAHTLGNVSGVNGATLTVGTGLTSGTATLTIGTLGLLTAGSTFNIQNNGSCATAMNLNGVVSGTVSLTKTGTGILDFKVAANTISGAINVNGGTLRVTSPATITGAGALTVNSGGLLEGSGSVAGLVTVNNGGTIRGGVNGTGTLTLSNAGASALTLNQGATIVWDGANPIAMSSAAAGVTLNGPVAVTLNGSPANGTGYLIINCGASFASTPSVANLHVANPVPGKTYTFRWDSSGKDILLDISNGKTWSGAGGDARWSTAGSGGNWSDSTAPVSGDAVTFTGSAQSSNLDDLGANLPLNGITFASGATTTFSLSPNTPGTDSINLLGPVVNQSASDQNIAIPLLLSGASRALNTSGGKLTISGTIDEASGGPFGLSKLGAGTVELQGANGFDGTVDINAGTLMLGHDSALGGTTAGAVVASGAALDLNGRTVGAEPVTINGTGPAGAGSLVNNSGSATLAGAVSVSTASTVGGSGNVALNGAVTATVTITKEGAGTLTLGGNNTAPLTGQINVNDGVLKVAHAGGLGSTTKTTLNNASALDLNGITFASAEPIDLNSTASPAVYNSNSTAANTSTGNKVLLRNTVIGGANDFTFGGIVSGTGFSLTKIGAGTVTLNGVNTFSGGLLILAGTVSGTTSANAFGASAGVITLGNSTGSDNATLSGGFAGPFPNPITVAGGNDGTATLTLSAAATFSGLVTLNNHDLTLAPITTLALGLSGGVTGTGNLIVAGTGTTGALTLSGVTAVNPAGTITNQGSNTGTTTISAPVGSSVTAITEASSTSPLTVSGGLAVNSSGTTLTSSGTALFTLGAGNVTGTGGGALTFNANSSGNFTVSAASINHNGLIVNSGSGSGTVTISGVVGTSVTGVEQNSANSVLSFTTAINTYNTGLLIKKGTVSGTLANSFGANANVITLGDSTGNASVTLQGAGAVTHQNPIQVASGNSGVATILSSAAATFSGAVTLNSHDLVLQTAASALTLSGGITSTGAGGNLTLNVTGAGLLTLSSQPVNHLGGIALQGAGNGGATISGGIGSNVTTINQNNNSSLLTISGPFVVNSDGTTINSASTLANALTLSSATVTGTGSLTLNGNGTGGLTVSAASITHTGDLTFNANSTGNFTVSAASINPTGKLYNTGSGSGTVTISGVVGTSVTGVEQNSASSVLSFTTAINTYNSGLVIKKGTVSGTVANSFGANANVITLGDSAGAANATLQGAGAVTHQNPIQVASGNSGVATITCSAGATFSGAVTLNSHDLVLQTAASALILSGGITSTGTGGTLTLNVTGAGLLTLSTQPVNHKGAITLQGTGAGGATIGATGGIGSNVTTINQNNNSSLLTISGPFAVNSDGTTINSASTLANALTLSSATVTGTGSLTLNGNGSGGLTVSAASITHTGDLTFNANSTGNFTVSAASINPTGKLYNTGSGSGTVTISGVVGTSVTGVEQNSASSVLSFTTAINTYNSGLVIKKGTVSGTVANSFGANANVITLGDSAGAANATLQGAGAVTHQNPIQVASGNSGVATITSSAAATFSGAVTLNSHDLVLQTAASALTLSGGVTSTGTGGTLTLNVTGAGLLTLSTQPVNHTGAITLQGTGAGGATIGATGGIGSNVTTINQNNNSSLLTISGPFTVNSAGTTINSASTLANAVTLSSATVSGTGSLTFNANGTGGITVSAASINPTGRIYNTGSSSGTVTLSGALGANVAGVEQNSAASRLVLSGANTAYVSGVTISQGTVDVGNANGLGASAAATVSFTGTSGKLRLASFSPVIVGLSANNAGVIVESSHATTASTLTVNNAAANTFSGILQDGGAAAFNLTKGGAGTLTLNGVNSVYTGRTLVNDGTLAIASLASVGAGASSLGAPATVANGSIDLGSAALIPTLRFENSGAVVSDRLMNLAGSAGGGAILEAAGSAAVTLSGAFSAAAGAKTLTLQGASVLANTYSGVIGGAANLALVKKGTGKWILGSVTHTYTGTTDIRAGTLEVNGTLSASSAVTVQSGATLAGTGNAAGTVAVLAGAKLDPGNGNSEVGNLTTGALTLENGSTLVINCSGATAGTLAYNAVLSPVGSALTVNGSVSVDLRDSSGATWTDTPGLYKLIRFNGTLAGSAASVNSFTVLDQKGNRTYAFSISADNYLQLTIGSTEGYVWDGSVDSSWLEGNNWSGGAALAGDGTETLTFGVNDAANRNTVHDLGAGKRFSGIVFQGVDTGDNSPLSFVLGTGASPAILLFGSIVNNNAALQTINLPMTLEGGSCTINAAAGDITISQPIGQSGTWGLIKAGANVLSMTAGAVNTFTGKTIVNAGTLRLVDETALGGNPAASVADQLTLAGGVLQAGATFTLDDANRGVTIGQGGGSIDVGASLTLTVSRVIAGSTTLGKTGEGTLTLNQANTYTGNLILHAGVLGVTANAGALGTGAASLTMAGGTLDCYHSAALAFNRPVSVTADSEIISEKSTGTGWTYTFTTLSMGGQTLTISGGNTTAAAGVTFSGTTTFTDGTTPALVVNNPLAGTSTTLTLAGISGNGYTLSFSGTGGTVVQTAAWNGTGSGLTLGAGFTGGTVTLNQANGFTGPVQISGGTLKVGVAGGLGAGSATTVNAGGTLDLNVAGVNETLNLNGGSVINSSATTAGQITSLITLQNNSVAGGSGAGVFTLGGQITGAFKLTKVGTGTLVLGNAANDFSGGVDLNAGNLQIAADRNLGATTGGLTFTGNGKLTISAGPLVLHADRTLSIGNTFTGTLDSGANLVTVNSQVTGAGALTKLGAGTLDFAAANDYSGLTTVSAGVLRLSGAGTPGAADAAGVSLSASGSLELNGVSIGEEPLWTLGGGIRSLATSSYGGLITMAAYMTITSDAGMLTLDNATTAGSSAINATFAGAGNITVGGAIGEVSSGAALSLYKTGAGTLTLNATDSTYTGSTFIQNGTVEIVALANSGAVGSLGKGTAIYFGNAATTGSLRFINSSPVTSSRALTLQSLSTGGGVLDASGSAPVTLSGGLSSASSGIKTMTLTGNSASVNTLSGAITGNANDIAISKTGSSVWVLSGNNTYDQGTTISGGTLRINTASPNSGTGSLGVTVQNGGTLDGTGNISGAVTVQSGGTMSAGDAAVASGVGTLTVASLNLQSGSFGIVKIGAGGANNKVSVTGALTLGGTGLYLYQAGTTTAFAPEGRYPLYYHGGTLTGVPQATLSVANAAQLPNKTFTFSDVNNWVVLDVVDSSMPGPEISVRYGDANGLPLVNGCAASDWVGTAFGDVALGTPVEREFTIVNVGDTDLSIGTVTVSGGFGQFTVSQQPGSALLAPSASTTFKLQYQPSRAGAARATVQLTNGDSDENPFTFDVSGRESATKDVIFVDDTASGNNNGTSFQDAYTSLAYVMNDQAGTTVAGASAEIWVAAGTYTPNLVPNTPATGRYFDLRTRIVRGGFEGDEGTPADRANIAGNAAILTGDMGGGILALHVMQKTVAGAATLDGVTVRDGYSSGAYDGAGLYLGDGSVTLTDCAFTNNVTGRAGGAIMHDTNADGLIVTRCAFGGNTANGYTAGVSTDGEYLSGADICVYRSGADVTVSDSTFTGSRATSAGIACGGAIAVRFFGGDNDSQLLITGSTFDACYAAGSGGAIHFRVDRQTAVAEINRLTIQHSVFKNCRAGNGGALTLMRQSDRLASDEFFVTVEDSLFQSNTGTGWGGAVHDSGVYGAHTYNFRRCKFLNNTGVMAGGAIYGPSKMMEAGARVCNFVNCEFAGNRETASAAGSGVGGGAIYAEGPMAIHNSTFVDNRTVIDGGAIRLLLESGSWPSPVFVGFGNIFRGNTATGSGDTIHYTGGATTPTVTMTDSFFEDTGAAYVSGSVTLVNPKTADPLLADPTGPVYNLKLGEGSPALDFHTTALGGGATVEYDVATAGASDVDDLARPVDIVGVGSDVDGFEYDAGAHEMQASDFIPVMEIRGNGLTIPHNNTPTALTNDTDFGTLSIQPGAHQKTRIFTIHSIGTTGLKLGQGALFDTAPVVTVSSGDPAGVWTVTTLPAPQTLPLGDTAGVSFAVKFAPTTVGAHSATLRIFSSDALYPAGYQVNISGAATDTTPIPVIEVLGGSPGVLIAKGDATPATADDTEFGQARRNSTSVTHTFTIRNNDTATKVLSIATTSENSAEFTCTQPESLTVDPNQTTTFTVTFAPVSTGRKTAVVTIASDDPDDGAFTFTVGGNATVFYKVRQITTTAGRLLWDINDLGFVSGQDDSGDPAIFSAKGGAAVRSLPAYNGYTARGIDESCDVVLGSTVSALGTGITFLFHSYCNDVTYTLDRTASPASPVAATGWSSGWDLFDVGGGRVCGRRLSNSGNSQSSVPLYWDLADIYNADLEGNELPAPSLSNTYSDSPFRINNLGWMVGYRQTQSSPMQPMIWIADPGLASGDYSLSGYSAIDLPLAPNGNTQEKHYVYGIQDGATPTVVGWVENGGSPRGRALKWTHAGGVTWTVAFVGADAGHNGRLYGTWRANAAVDINDAGVIVGISQNRNSGDDFNWGSSDPRGWFVRYPSVAANSSLTWPSGTDCSTAWVDHGGGLGMEDLNLLIHADSSAWQGKVLWAGAVNDDGVIVARVADSFGSYGAVLYPEDFNIDGYAGTPPTGQEIDVTDETNVSQPSGAAVPADGDTGNARHFGSALIDGGTSVRTFRIHNTVAGVTLDIAGATATGDFTVSTPSSPVSGIDYVTVDVTFNPSAAGARSGVVTIFSTDCDEPAYVLNVKGMGLTAPDIEVLGLDNLIAAGDITPEVADNTLFPETDVGEQSAAHTFTIKNKATANAVLNVSSVAVADDTHFIITQPDPLSVAIDGTTTFTVTFAPTAAQSYTTTVTVNSDDPDTPAYMFHVRGVGAQAVPQEMDVQGNSTTINDGDATPSLDDHTDFGTARVAGGTVNRSFTIQNTGGVTLNLTGSSPYVAIGGANPGDFSVTQIPSASVIAGFSTAFQVTFNPSGTGVRTATVSIASDDSDENPYNFSIQGTGMEQGTVIRIR